MVFRDGPYVTVWEITNQDKNYAKIRMSASRKDKETGEYFTDFSGFVSLISGAFKQLGRIEQALEEDGRCRIKINTFSISNRYDKEEGREYTNYAILDFSFPGEENDDSAEETDRPKKAKKPTSKSSKAGNKKKSPPPDLDDEGDDEEDDEDLPF